MKLLGIVIKNYNEQFYREVINLSSEYIIHYDFINDALRIRKNESFITGVYGKWVYSITPIVGQNGCGKSTLLNLLGYSLEDRCNDNRLGYLKERKLTCSYLIVYEAKSDNYFLECFNLKPKNLKANYSDESIIGTPSAFLDPGNRIQSLFINNKYEYKVSKTNNSNFLTDESLVYMPIDTTIHRYYDITVSGSRLPDNPYLKRDYIIDSGYRSVEYRAFLKLYENKMISSGLRLKFSIVQLTYDFFNPYMPMTSNTEIIDKYKDICFVTENTDDLIGNIYVSFMNRISSIAKKGNGISLRDNFFKHDFNQNYQRLLNCNVYGDAYYAYEQVERLLFEEFDNYLDYQNGNEFLKKYYELSKELIIRLFIIRDNIIPGIGYFILDVKYGSKINNDILLLFDTIDKLTDFYDILEGNDKGKKEGERRKDWSTKDLWLVSAFSGEFDEHIQGAQKKYKLQRLVEPLILFDEYLISDGERRILQLLGSILGRFESYIGEWQVRKVGLPKVIPVIVDEIETNMHLEWSRNFIGVFTKILSEFIEESIKIEAKGYPFQLEEYVNMQIQLVFSTHSPFMLSDIINNNAVVLHMADNRVVQGDISKTFAENIQEIMSKPMFVEDCYGSHAIEILNEIISDLNCKGEKTLRYIRNKDDELKIILNIGEEVLRRKLLEMYNDKYYKNETDNMHKYIDEVVKNTNLNTDEKAHLLKEYMDLRYHI